MKKQQRLEHEQLRLENLQRLGRVKSDMISKKYKVYLCIHSTLRCIAGSQSDALVSGSQRNTEGQLMVETWIEEYQRLWRESCKAKNERLRLQTIHDKVHTKAYLTKYDTL